VTRCPPPRACAHSPLRSLLALALLCAACLALPAPAGAASTSAAPASGGWDTTQQRQVLAAGLMEANGSFDGAGQLSVPQANAAMAALATWLQSQAERQTLPVPPSSEAEPAAAAVPVARAAQSPVTVAGFDRMLVEELGLGEVAAHVQTGPPTSTAGPPSATSSTRGSTSGTTG
jgi:hypothetical protein